MDLSNYLARRTCQHVHEAAGRGSSFRDKLFTLDPDGEIPIWGDYRIAFKDEGTIIKVLINRGSKKLEDIFGKIGNIEVESKYQDVITSVEVKDEKGKVSVEARMKYKDNASGRTQNKDKLFFAIYHAAVKPILKAVH